MKKDTVYIDTEDDITVIIGKIKAASEKVVALVPPKRVGVLQSAVNLRLLQRAAKQAKKHLVLVTNDAALKSLAASEKLPVAKTLQSKPEIPEIATLDVDSGDDIIDGAALPIGDHARTGGEADPVVADEAETHAIGATAIAAVKAPKAGKKPAKVPDFNRLRKKIILFGALGILLIGFLVWAIKFAPRATITIDARTIEESLNLDVALKADAEPSLKEATLPIEKRELSDDVSVDVTPTGTKNVGDKAAGEVKFRVCANSPMTSPGDIPAGTTISTDGKSYTTESSASFSFDTVSGGCIIYRSDSVGITAAKSGTDSNVSSANFDVSGRSDVTGSGSASGGTDKEVKVLTSGDVKKAMSDVDEKLDDDDKQTELTKQFGDDYIVLPGTFTGKKDEVKPSPAVGDEVKGDAKLTGKITYTLYGVPKSALGGVLDKYFEDAIKDEPNQRVYDNGIGEARFMTLTGEGSSWHATLIATANVGPDIKDDQVKEVAKGKKYDEIRTALESINGVERAETTFWPFWVNKAPNDSGRITVVFHIDGKD